MNLNNNDLIIGSHVGFSNKDQLLGSVREALSYNANTFMFYTGAPQNTKRLPIDDNLTYSAYELMKEHHFDLSKVIIHAPYIVNLGNLENFEINVPPIEEQKRIVDKIEQLLPLCNDIENLINSID